MDKVFVILPPSAELGKPFLKWALNHFDNNKTEIIFPQHTAYGAESGRWNRRFTNDAMFMCEQKEFRAKILPTQATEMKSLIAELCITYGMRKLVIGKTGWEHRRYGPDDTEMLTKTIMDVVNSKNADKVTTASKQVERELVSRSNYVKLQEQRDNAIQEAEKLRNQRECSTLRSNFTVTDLEQATQNFRYSLLLGKGAYGSVYKGYLGGTYVAIKILNPECTQGVLGFKQEVDILTTFRHPNLVTLIGVCYESSALIYEFLPNGSLEDHLTGEDKTPLTWQVRTRIMCEICVALNFLHSNRPNMVIHGDLKPDNILLDANFTSKLGDFGISRIIERSNTNNTLYYSTRNPLGTFLYMDPEFAHTGKLTEKSDVFSFGVIILRLLTGKPAQGVVFGVEQAIEDGTLDEMIDKVAGEWPFDKAKELAELGLRCVEMRRIDRPNLFNDVWPILERLQRNI